MYVYNAAWFALAVVLTLLLGAVTVLAWRRRGPRSALFWGGLALMPMALYLTGLLRVLSVIADQVTGFIVGFAFSPVVWAGVALGGLGVLLMAVSGTMKRRGVGASTRPRAKASPTGGASRHVEAPSPARPAPSDDQVEGMDDIEAILRKHGIQ